MFFVIIGIFMAVAKYFDIVGLGDISWWWCAVPFALAALYWEITDEFFHKKDNKEIQAHEKRLDAQRKKMFEERGLLKRDYKVIRAGETEDHSREKYQD